MRLNNILIVVFTILIICVLNSLDKKSECFSNSPTNYILSNSEKKSNADKYANIDEEILIGEQFSSKGGRFENAFKFFKAPLNKYFVLSAKLFIASNPKDKQEISIFKKIINTTQNTHSINQLLNSNNIIQTDNTKNYKYYIKFVSNLEYLKEKKQELEILERKQKYKNCIQKHMNLGLDRVKLLEICGSDI